MQKGSSASGSFVTLTPTKGSPPGRPLGTLSPDPRYKQALRARHGIQLNPVQFCPNKQQMFIVSLLKAAVTVTTMLNLGPVWNFTVLHKSTVVTVVLAGDVDLAELNPHPRPRPRYSLFLC